MNSKATIVEKYSAVEVLFDVDERERRIRMRHPGRRKLAPGRCNHT